MKTRFNLQPWRAQRRQGQKQKFITATAIVGFVAAGLCAFNYWIETSYIDDQRQSKQTLENEIKGLESVKKQVEEIDLLIQEVNKQISAIELLQANRGVALKLLDHLAQRLPESVFVDRVSFDGQLLTINGVVENDTGVAEFMRVMQAHPLLDTAVLKGMEAAKSSARYTIPEGSEIKSFTVEISLLNFAGEDQ